MKSNSRGHETAEHRALKATVAELLLRAGYAPVLSEHCGCDVAAMRPGGLGVLAVEIERSKRNLLRNLERDFAHGCSEVLVVCPDFHSAAEIARALARHVPRAQQVRVGLTAVSALPQIFPLPRQ